MKPNFPMLAVTVVAASLSMLGICGCTAKQQGTGISIPSYEALKPDHLTLERCSLELAGTKYEADIRQTKQGNDLQLDLMALGQVIENERYRSTDETFSVVDAGGERYEPPIPLIKYGMHVGDTWTWSGSIETGSQPHSTTASVSTASEDLTIKGGTVKNVVRIEVLLSIDSGRPNAPSTRKMTFWIAPDMGVVRRAFGDYSSRKPLEE